MWQRSAAWITHGFQWLIHKVGGLWSLQWVLVLHGLLDIPSCSWYWVHFQKFIPSWTSCCTICVIFISAWALVLGTFEKIHTKLVLIRIYIYFNSVVSKFCKTFPKFQHLFQIYTFKKIKFIPFFLVWQCKTLRPPQRKTLQPQYCIFLEFFYQPGPGTKADFWLVWGRYVPGISYILKNHTKLVQIFSSFFAFVYQSGSNTKTDIWLV